MYKTVYTLITGASEGFGKSLAFECASRKMNLVLIALPGPELDYLADFIQRNYHVRVITLEKDLSKEENCISLFDEITTLGIQVNMLINNAGIGSTMLFDEGSLLFYQRQIKLNVLGTTLITRLFIDMLRKNSPSYILNVGSLCCFFFLAKKQVYGGTKSYIYFFSKSLRREVAAAGISVSVVCPGGMNTNAVQYFTKKNAGWLAKKSYMNPEEVAPVAIKELLQGKEVIIPGLINKFFMLLDKLLPSRIKKIITNYHMKKMKPIDTIHPSNSFAPAFKNKVPLSV